MCKKNYRPPRPIGGTSSQRKAAPKLWIVNLDGDLEVPEREYERYAESEKAARKRLRGDGKSTLDSFFWNSKPKMADTLRPGHWILMVTRYAGGTVEVAPPKQFLWLDRYSRGNGKFRYVFHIEGPKTSQTVSWTRFRRALRTPLLSKYVRPRTRAVIDPAEADLLMSLWSLGGRFRGKS